MKSYRAPAKNGARRNATARNAEKIASFVDRFSYGVRKVGARMRDLSSIN